MPTVQVEEITTLDEATQQERRKDFCVYMSCFSCKALLDYKVHNVCECLLLCPEVWLAEAKIGQVEKTIENLIETGNPDTQLKALLTSTLAEVQEACALYVFAFVSVSVSECSLFVHAFAMY